MPAYTLRIGERSYWIDARSDTGALVLTTATLADDMSGDDEVGLVVYADAREVLRTTVSALRAEALPCGQDRRRRGTLDR